MKCQWNKRQINMIWRTTYLSGVEPITSLRIPCWTTRSTIPFWICSASVIIMLGCTCRVIISYYIYRKAEKSLLRWFWEKYSKYASYVHFLRKSKERSCISEDFQNNQDLCYINWKVPSLFTQIFSFYY